MRSGWPTPCPIVIAGFREAFGSWNTIASWRRSGRSCRSGRPARSRALPPDAAAVGAAPARAAPARASSCPEPDSPTRPNTSPRRTSKLTPSTACTWPLAAPEEAPATEVEADGRGPRPRSAGSPCCRSGSAPRPRSRAAPARPGRPPRRRAGTRPAGRRRVDERRVDPLARARTRTGSAAGTGSRSAGRPGRRGRRRCCAARSVSRLMTDASSPCVYGCVGAAKTASTGPSSTMRPAYITATRSRGLGDDPEVVGDRGPGRAARRGAGGRAARGSAPRPPRRARWSARRTITTAGRSAIARAIMMRWRMPPENSCGWLRARVGGMPTETSESRAIDSASVVRDAGAVRLERLDEVVAHPHQRVEAGHRLLEDQRRCPRRAGPAQRAPAMPDQLLALQPHAARALRCAPGGSS